MSAPNAKPKQGSRWGSLLSGAVSGLESRLDTILGDDPEASAKSRAVEKAQIGTGAGQTGGTATTLALPRTSSDVSRSSSRNRVNDRLQERLAKAVANQKSGSQAPSEAPSRTSSPLVGADSPRTSLGSRPSIELSQTQKTETQETSNDVVDGVDHASLALEPSPEPPSTLLTSDLPINPARLSSDSGPRSFIDIPEEVAPTSELVETNGTSIPVKTTAELEAEIEQMQADYAETEKQRQEEMHANMERIDALQAKLQYLAKETVAAAKEINGSSSEGNLEHKLAEKDERIALLMEEGEKLSKTEMRHLMTIKKLRAKSTEDEKATAEVKEKLAKVEANDSELRQKLRRLEQSEKQNTERLKRLPKAELDLQNLRIELESTQSTVTTLRRQLAEAGKKAEEADVEAKKAIVQMDSKKTADLQDELADARLEKRLAEERAGAEARRNREAAEREKEHFQGLETELRTEIANMESRMETLRFRAEEASSDTAGDSRAKLLRQIETLQTQYSLAAENWRTIEGSLNARVTAIERERDEATKRETEIRKKARDVTGKSRRTEEELESASERSRQLSEQLHEQSAEMKKLQSQVETSTKALEDAKAGFDRQRRILEAEFNQKAEEARSRLPNHGLTIGTPTSYSKHSQVESPTLSRKANGVEPQRRGMNRVFSHDSSLVPDRPISRRSSKIPPLGPTSRTSGTPDHGSPTISRQESILSFANLNGMAGGMPPTPSIHTQDMDGDEAFEHNSSPHQTVNDVISASTVHTGPSVQLVERMSSSIRKLESEKAAHKDELARLLAQRDEARNEVVALMREADASKGNTEKAARLEKEVADVKSRYDACLEMLGEREEEVQELKGDISDLKEMYRALADKMGR